MSGAARSRYSEFYDLAPVGFFTINARGRILDANPAAATLLGVTRSALVRHRLSSFVHPEDEDIFHLHRKQLAETGKPQKCDLRMVAMGGAAFWVRLQISPARGSGADPVGRVVISDITRRRRAEESYRTLFSEMLNGFSLHEIVYDAHGKPVDYRFLAVNPAFERMTGLKAEDLLGKSVLEVMPGTEPRWIEAYARVAVTGVPACFENYAVELRKHFEVTAFRPAPNQFACLFSDITERKRSEAVLRTSVSKMALAVQEKTVLLKEIHHRVKNNLAVTASLLSMKADDCGTEARLALEESRQRVHSIALVHDHLYSHEGLDRVNFGEYARDLVEGVYSSFGGEKDRIGLDLRFDPVELPIDRAVPCALILNELLSNALKYAFPGGRTGRILVSFRQPESGSCELVVEDDGVGLPDGALDAHGKSLGLRIVKILTRQLDGSVERAASCGTRIVLRFPAAG